MLAFGPYTVEMKPVITGVLTLRDTVVADNKVTYNKVFGTGTSLVYTPTLNGVKEDIILQTYVALLKAEEEGVAAGILELDRKSVV